MLPLCVVFLLSYTLSAHNEYLVWKTKEQFRKMQYEHGFDDYLEYHTITFEEPVCANKEVRLFSDNTHRLPYRKINWTELAWYYDEDLHRWLRTDLWYPSNSKGLDPSNERKQTGPWPTNFVFSDFYIGKKVKLRSDMEIRGMLNEIHDSVFWTNETVVQDCG